MGITLGRFQLTVLPSYGKTIEPFIWLYMKLLYYIKSAFVIHLRKYSLRHVIYFMVCRILQTDLQTQKKYIFLVKYIKYKSSWHK